MLACPLEAVRSRLLLFEDVEIVMPGNDVLVVIRIRVQRQQPANPHIISCRCIWMLHGCNSNNIRIRQHVLPPQPFLPTIAGIRVAVPCPCIHPPPPRWSSCKKHATATITRTRVVVIQIHRPRNRSDAWILWNRGVAIRLDCSNKHYWLRTIVVRVVNFKNRVQRNKHWCMAMHVLLELIPLILINKWTMKLY